MAKPLTFSVGIPTYNQAEYLEATILSLLNQTRPPDETVISDRFSTGQTAEIIASVNLMKAPLGILHHRAGFMRSFTCNSFAALCSSVSLL
ncbi:MAG TPA: glycosyltransferase [Edaphobacter sp.]|nr:glycosyltransferase [Edaphobacter sp.]